MELLLSAMDLGEPGQFVEAEMENTSQVWNNLEIAKLFVSALTPIIVALFGMWISRHLKRLEHLQWASQKLIEKRLEVYSKLAPELNAMYCYFDYIGDVKMKNPVDALGIKRSADNLFFVNAPLFSPRFRDAYHEFIRLCFIPGPLNEFDASATLRTDVNIRKDMFAKRGLAWQPEWDSYFVAQKDVTSREEIFQGYQKMMDIFACDLGVGPGENQRAPRHRSWPIMRLVQARERGSDTRRAARSGATGGR